MFKVGPHSQNLNRTCTVNPARRARKKHTVAPTPGAQADIKVGCVLQNILRICTCVTMELKGNKSTAGHAGLLGHFENAPFSTLGSAACGLECLHGKAQEE